MKIPSIFSFFRKESIFFSNRYKIKTDSVQKQERINDMKNEEKKKVCRKKTNTHSLEHLRDAIDHTRPASVNDCTGYTPVIPLSAEESESYEDLLDIPAPARYKRHSEGDI